MLSPHRKQNVLEKMIQLILKCSVETELKAIHLFCIYFHPLSTPSPFLGESGALGAGMRQ